MLAEERRARLRAAMSEAGIEAMVVYGNAWQGDYLRYAADFGILEGHGIAIVTADGATELYLDSAVEAERAEAETTGLDDRSSLADIAPRGGAAARPHRQPPHRRGAAPLPAELARRRARAASRWRTAPRWSTGC